PFLGKLSDCSERDPQRCELYIVEGDSAGGSAKQGRDSKFQAIIPIRGKLINVEKARIDKVLENKEIQSLITAIGCGFGKEDFDLSGLRYNRIVIMTDADVDGSHIRTLLLTFFFRELKPLIESGHIYIAKPPLYKVTRKKNESYIDTDDQLDRYLLRNGCEDIEVRNSADNSLVSAEKITQIASFVTSANQIVQGLHRHGIEPEKYFALGKDGKFPIARIAVRNADGTVSETFVYSREEEAAFVAETTERLPKLEEVTLPENEKASEGTPEGEESAGAVSGRRGLHPAIDLTDIYEANACEELCKLLAEESYTLNQIYQGGEPLFKIVEKEDEKPVLTLSDLFEEVKKNGRQGLRIQRYKGLGEMDPEQLWETTMDPERRKMIQVTMEDALEAERMFTLLMGDDVDPRRDYIEKHAAGVKDLDI
ncbi:MAG: DNA gyrase subunit B, partial [Lentisphaeria bacterium]|nr:DNA gyrase subunit B [Lentisphaeria bacterium]